MGNGNVIAQNTESFEYFATEHFRLSGVYWGLTALYLMGQEDKLDRDEIINWVLRCQYDNGGFGGSERHDPHLLYTLSALQILAIFDRLDLVDGDRIASCTSMSYKYQDYHLRVSPCNSPACRYCQLAAR